MRQVLTYFSCFSCVVLNKIIKFEVLRPPGSDHYFHTCRPSIPTFKNVLKQNKFQVRIVIATGGSVGLAERIIDGTHAH